MVYMDRTITTEDAIRDAKRREWMPTPTRDRTDKVARAAKRQDRREAAARRMFRQGGVIA